MYSFHHCGLNGKGNRSKTFLRLSFSHLSFSSTTEASHFQCPSLPFPAKGGKSDVQLLTW